MGVSDKPHAKGKVASGDVTQRVGVELLGLDRGRTGGPGRDRVLHR